MSGTIVDQVQLRADLALYRFGVDQSSYLLVRNQRALLVDCHSNQLRRQLAANDLPMPELILHTHVQPEHCREGNQFPDAEIRVPAGDEVLASDPEAYRAQAQTVWDDPDDWGNTGGAEAFGVGGCVTCFPPEVPLVIAEPLRDGETVEWQGLELRCFDLAAHGRHALGFALHDGGELLALFIGDLFRHPACLVNVYDLTKSYGGTRLDEVPGMLRRVAELGTDLMLPATGPMIFNGREQARQLAERCDAYFASLRWQGESVVAEPLAETPMVGRYHCVHDGVYQVAKPGNNILFIDGEGRGMFVDPGPCDYHLNDRDACPVDDPERYQKINARRIAELHAELDQFEAECGLKHVDLCLITHFHGDHYDLLPVLKERYDCRVAAWDLVARVVEAPWDFPYACRLPWYDIGFDHATVDDVLRLGETYHWHDVAIESTYLPGHCHAHGAHLLTFNGKRIAITGDTVQGNGHPDTLGFVIENHSIPGAEGNLAAYQNLSKFTVDLNLGGHGSRFANCNAVYTASIARIEHAMAHLRPLLFNGDIDTAFRRPEFPRMQPVTTQ